MEGLILTRVLDTEVKYQVFSISRAVWDMIMVGSNHIQICIEKR